MLGKQNEGVKIKWQGQNQYVYPPLSFDYISFLVGISSQFFPRGVLLIYALTPNNSVIFVNL